jgi:hypothetical protein
VPRKIACAIDCTNVKRDNQRTVPPLQQWSLN